MTSFHRRRALAARFPYSWLGSKCAHKFEKGAVKNGQQSEHAALRKAFYELRGLMTRESEVISKGREALARP